MTYQRVKTIGGRKYYYRVRSVREGKTVRQIYVAYDGPVDPVGHGGPKKPARRSKRQARPRPKPNTTVDGVAMDYRGDFANGTPLYSTKNVPQDEIVDVTSSFNRIPAGMQ